MGSSRRIHTRGLRIGIGGGSKGNFFTLPYQVSVSYSRHSKRTINLKRMNISRGEGLSLLGPPALYFPSIRRAHGAQPDLLPSLWESLPSIIRQASLLLPDLGLALQSGPFSMSPFCIAWDLTPLAAVFFQTSSDRQGKVIPQLVAALCEGIICGAVTFATDCHIDLVLSVVVVLSMSFFLSNFRLCFVQIIEDILEISFFLNDLFHPDIPTL